MRRLGLVLLWLAFVFGLLEFAGYVYFSLEVSRPIGDYGYPAQMFREHGELGYLYAPGFSGHFKGTGYDHIPIAINAHGFRDDPFGPRQPGRARVVVLGDSVVFGSGVAEEDRFTECLAREGPRLGVGAGPEVLNLGVNKYTFGHYLTLARLRFMGTGPDAVLVGLTLNDFAPMEEARPARRLQERRDSWLAKPAWLSGAQEWLGRTHAARLLDELETRVTHALMSADEREEYHTKWMRTVVAGWQDPGSLARFTAELDAFAAVMEDAGVPYGFVVLPELNTLTRPGEFSSPRRILTGLLRERGLPFCDGHDGFPSGPEAHALFLPHDGVHYTPAGHRALCAAVLECVARGHVSLGRRPAAAGTPGPSE